MVRACSSSHLGLDPRPVGVFDVSRTRDPWISSWRIRDQAEALKLEPTIFEEFDGERAVLMAEYKFVIRSAIGREPVEGCVNRSERLGLPYDWDATVLTGVELRAIPLLLIAGVTVRNIARAKKATSQGQANGALACHGVSVHGQR